jgi:hypothetical protein
MNGWDKTKRWNPDLSDRHWEPERYADPGQPAKSREETAPDRRPPSQATVLVELAEDVQLFHTANGSFAVVPVGDHRKAWSLQPGGRA